MYILAIETTGPKGSAALIDERGAVSCRISAEEMNHLKDLMPMAQALLDTENIAKSELAAVAASIGPGSFTGIRIGVASARAISQALSIPAISVPTLDSFKTKCDGNAVIMPVFNARRGQVYGGIYDENGTDILKSGPYMLTDCFAALDAYFAQQRNDLPCGMPQAMTVKVYGDGIDAYEEQLADFSADMAKKYGAVQIILAEKEERYQLASMTAVCALEKFKAGETMSYDRLLPDYMRATEAEQKLKDGTLEKERAAKMARFKAR